MQGEYPGEEISFSSPQEGVEIMTVNNSLRLWRGYLEQYAICTPQPSNVGYSFNKYRRKLLECGHGASLLFEPGETDVVEDLTGPGSFWMVFIDPRIVEEFVRGSGIKSSLINWWFSISHTETSRIRNPKFFPLRCI